MGEAKEKRMWARKTCFRQMEQHMQVLEKQNIKICDLYNLVVKLYLIKRST